MVGTLAIQTTADTIRVAVIALAETQWSVALAHVAAVTALRALCTLAFAQTGA